MASGEPTPTKLSVTAEEGGVTLHLHSADGQWSLARIYVDEHDGWTLVDEITDRLREVANA